MWTPTHVQVTVLQARNLIPKGKGGTNDAYVTIQLAKEKYQTTVKEKADRPEWFEECDLPIPDKSKAILQLNAFHRSFLKLDEFLGHLTLPLTDFPIYERPHSKWYALRGRPGKKSSDEKYRGEIEVKVTFIVQSKSSSEINLSKIGKDKRLGSLKSLHNIGDKLKLPTRSSSFGKNEKNKSAAAVQPLVDSPSREGIPSDPGLEDSPEPIFKTTRMRSTNLEDARRFSCSTACLDERELYQFADFKHEERSVDADPTPSSTANADTKDNLQVSPLPARTSPVVNHHLDRVKLSYFTHNVSPNEGNTEDQVTDKEVEVHRSRPFKREGLDIAKLPWSPDDSPRTSSGDDLKRFDRTRQPVLRSSGRMKRKPAEDSDDILDGRPKSTSSSSEQQEIPLLTLSDPIDVPKPDTLAPEEDMLSGSASPDWREARQERLGSSKERSLPSIPASIPEDTEDSQVPEVQVTEVKPRQDKERRKVQIVDERRHTLQTEQEVKAATHKLHQSFMEVQKQESVPPEILEHYDDYTKEDLIRLVMTQKDQLAKKDQYICDLESYIDNLLVRVISVTPKLLQNPYQKNNNSANNTPKHSMINTNIRNNQQQSVMTNKQSFLQTCTPTKKANSNPFKQVTPSRK